MPTPVLVCGGECGLQSPGPTTSPDQRHWNTPTGTIALSTAITRGGGQSYRFNSSGVGARLQKNWATPPTINVARIALYFTSLPNIDCNIIQLAPLAGTSVVLRFINASSSITPALGTTVTGATAFPVTTGVWYIVTFRGNVADAGGTRTATAKAKIDGTAFYTDMGTVSAVVAASTITSFRVGNAGNAEAVTCDLYIDDITVSLTPEDFPYPDGHIVGLKPTRDGTHSFNAVTDFKYNNTTNMPSTSPTDTWTYVDNSPVDDPPADFLAISGAATSEYLEWGFESLPAAVAAIHGLNVVTGNYAQGTAVNAQTLRLVDGGSTNDVVVDGDFSFVTVGNNEKIYATAPSGGAWTKAKVDALLLRWTSSFTAADIVPVPYMSAALLEVDYNAVAGAVVAIMPIMTTSIM